MKERFDTITEVCRGKRCLDIGTVGDVQHHLHAPAKWLFHHVAQVASFLVGVDLDPAALAAFRAKGYRNLVCANAEQFAFTTRFDVVVAGEIIEHLSNPGLFLRACRNHLVDGGVLVVTTPNTFSVNHALKALLFADVPLFYEHTNAYTPSLLRELFQREDLRIERMEYFTEKNPGLKNVIFRLLSWLRPTWSEGILVIAHAGGRPASRA
jgi:2-polyprenyl-3-methyl-5-hydroxy-6-metoxy-1,4-benzoquinol methylase